MMPRTCRGVAGSLAQYQAATSESANVIRAATLASLRHRRVSSAAFQVGARAMRSVAMMPLRYAPSRSQARPAGRGVGAGVAARHGHRIRPSNLPPKVRANAAARGGRRVRATIRFAERAGLAAGGKLSEDSVAYH